MRTIQLRNHKSGQAYELHLDTLPPAQFVPDAQATQGIEVELPLRRADTLAPAPGEIVSSLFGTEEWRSEEVSAHTCEIKTRPFHNLGELLAEYRACACWLLDWAKPHGLSIVPVAAEPLELITEVSSYGFIPKIAETKYGAAVLARSYADCTQLNIHVPDGDALLALFRAMVRLAPILAGMFASSPFAGSRLAGVQSFRHVVRRGLANGGDPEVLPKTIRWEEYIRSHQALTVMGPWFPTLFALNGMIRIRPDRMCVELGVTDLIADPRHLAGYLALCRRLAYRILLHYRDSEPLPDWFGPDEPAVQDAAFRSAMLSAVRWGADGLCCTQSMKVMRMADAFSELVRWAQEAPVVDDLSLPFESALPGLIDLIEHGAPALRLLKQFHALHPTCADPRRGCSGCRIAVIEVCRQLAADFATQVRKLPGELGQ